MAAASDGAITVIHFVFIWLCEVKSQSLQNFLAKYGTFKGQKHNDSTELNTQDYIFSHF